MKNIKVFLALGILLILSTTASADIPNLINFQGILDSAGNPLANKTKSVEFRIYAVPAGGTVFWSETQSVTTNAGGVFNVLLGFSNPIPDTVFDDTVRYLSINVGTDGEMSPRQQIVSNAYGYRVATVDGATGGVISGNTSIQSDLTVSGKATIGPGHTNTGTSAFVAGANNTASGQSAMALGGSCTANAFNAAALGGFGNTASSTVAVVVGGQSNTASGLRSTVTGGIANSATGENSTVGGENNVAAGRWSLAAGRQAKANHEGTFVWGASIGADFASTASNQFLIRAPGGVGIGTTSPQGALDVSSTTGAFIVPRMTTAQRDALTAVNGMIIYNTTTDQFNFREAGAWVTK